MRTGPILLALALSACGNPAPEPDQPRPSPTPAPPSSTAPTIAPLTAADLKQAQVAGELACSFTDTGDRLLMIARGDVGGRTAHAVLRTDRGIARVTAPGGFNAIVRGARFTGGGLTASVAVTGPATGGGESPPMPATLTVERDGAAPLVTSGDWTCGP
jgi:hypothetical protein